MKKSIYPAFCLLPTAYCLLLLLAAPALNQDGSGPAFPEPMAWAATYGGHNYDWAESIQETRDGGYIVAGYYTSYSVDSIFSEGWGHWVLKLRPDGTVEWQRAYEGIGAVCIQQTNDGGYIVAGATRSFSIEGQEIHHLCVLKLRPDGTVEWCKTYGGTNWDRSTSICQTTDGGYVVAGWTNSYGVGDYDLWVLKLGAEGMVEWQKTYGGANRDEGESIWQTVDGGYVVAGWTNSYGAGDYDLWVLKLGAEGMVEWQKTYGGAGVDGANSIQQTLDGGYIVAGGTGSFGAGKTDVWVLKLGPDGKVQWQKVYGGSGFDEASSIQQTREGGYIVAGHTRSFGAGDVDAWVLKLGPDGTIEWQRAYGGVDWDEAKSVQQTRDEGYVVAGKSASFGLNSGLLDSWILKLKPDGSIHPSCNHLMVDTTASAINSNATILATNAIAGDSEASPLDSSVEVQTTNVSAQFLCP